MIKIIRVNESLVSSIYTDIFTFGSILASFYLNFKYIGGNNFVDFILTIAVFSYLVKCGSNSKKIKIYNAKNKEDAVEFINKDFKDL